MLSQNSLQADPANNLRFARGVDNYNESELRTDSRYVNHITDEKAMARFMIRQDDQWLASAGRDVRGWPVQDQSGRILGVVEDVFFDAKAGRVDSVVTASGRVIPSTEYHIGEHVIVVNETVGAALPSARHADQESPPPESDPDSFDAKFHAHFDATYGPQGQQDFQEYLPAYRFGRMQALEPLFYGRPFERAEEDLRALFELHFPDDSYDAKQKAIRFGYELGARIWSELDDSILKLEQEGLLPYELDRSQIRLATEEPAVDQARDKSSGMSIPGAQTDQAKAPDEDGSTRE